MTNEHRNKKNMRRDEAKDMMNRLGNDGKPFLFLIDYTCENCIRKSALFFKDLLFDLF